MQHDGKIIANIILENLSNNIKEIKALTNTLPKLVIISVGNDIASQIYIRNKLKAAEKIGILAINVRFDISINTSNLTNEIEKLNNDPLVTGVIIQLPLPSHIDKSLILSAVDPKKDVDGFHPLNVGYSYSSTNKGFVPSTALGCLKLIKTQITDLSGKHAVIVGRSQIVGRPLGALLLNANCTVSICHSKTKNLINITKQADIIVTAIGKPYFFDMNFFNNNAIIIDVGINRSIDNKIIGDVNFPIVYPYVQYISPVPGGVGPLTVAYLLHNTIKAFIVQYKLNIILND